MKVTEFPHNLELAKPTKGYVRSPGLHASDIYGSLFKALDPKRYDKRDKDGEPTKMDTLKMEAGTSFEEVLEVAIGERLLVDGMQGERPGEFTTEDGIIYSPDYLFFNGGTTLGEFKVTWYSMRGAPYDERFEKWMVQIKMYLFHLKLSTARLYVLFINGNYQPPKPCLKAWELTFTPRELEDNWLMLRRHAVETGMLP